MTTAYAKKLSKAIKKRRKIALLALIVRNSTISEEPGLTLAVPSLGGSSSTACECACNRIKNAPGVANFCCLAAAGRSRMIRQENSAVPIVLVVEDEWLVREAIVQYLQAAGCVVLEAASGEDALSVLDHEQAIDVLLTDIRLNGSMNGWEVGEAFRRRHGDMPVIYASGHSVQPPRQVPGSLFFNKPYNPSDILNACQRLTEARRAGTARH